MKIVIELSDGELSRAVAQQVDAAISKLTAAEIINSIEAIASKQSTRVTEGVIEKIVKDSVAREVEIVFKGSGRIEGLRQYAMDQVVLAARDMALGKSIGWSK